MPLNVYVLHCMCCRWMFCAKVDEDESCDAFQSTQCQKWSNVNQLTLCLRPYSKALVIFSPSAQPSEPPKKPKLWVTHTILFTEPPAVVLGNDRHSTLTPANASVFAIESYNWSWYPLPPKENFKKSTEQTSSKRGSACLNADAISIEISVVEITDDGTG